MLSISEFRDAVAAYNRRMVLTFSLTLLVLFAFLGTVALFREPLLALLARQFGEVASEIIVGLSPAPALAILLGGIWLGERSAMRNPRLSCPACGKSLAGIRTIVIATRNCGWCGQRVLAEPEPFTNEAVGG